MEFKIFCEVTYKICTQPKFEKGILLSETASRTKLYDLENIHLG